MVPIPLQINSQADQGFGVGEMMHNEAIVSNLNINSELKTMKSQTAKLYK